MPILERVKFSRCDIKCLKYLEFGRFMLYLCSRRGLNIGHLDEKTVFLIYSFSVL